MTTNPTPTEQATAALEALRNSPEVRAIHRALIAAQAATETTDDWQTPIGRAVESAMSLLGLALERTDVVALTVGDLRRGGRGTVTSGKFAGRPFTVRSHGTNGLFTLVRWADNGKDGSIHSDTSIRLTD